MQRLAGNIRQLEDSCGYVQRAHVTTAPDTPGATGKARRANGLRPFGQRWDSVICASYARIHADRATGRPAAGGCPAAGMKVDLDDHSGRQAAGLITVDTDSPSEVLPDGVDDGLGGDTVVGGVVVSFGDGSPSSLNARVQAAITSGSRAKW